MWYGSPFHRFVLNRYAKEGPYCQLQEDAKIVVVQEIDDIDDPRHQVEEF